MTRQKILLISIYSLLVVASFLYIRSVLKVEKLPVSEKEEKVLVQPKEAKVSVRVFLGNKIISVGPVTAKNTDSVSDMLSDFRDKDGLMYEKISYTYGTELDFIYNQKAPNGYKWKIYADSEDITSNIDKTNLKNNQVYEIKLIKSE